MPSCATRVPWGPSLRAAVFQQASGVAITSSTSAWWTIKTMEEEERRERRRRQRQQVVNCCKQLAAFLFSHIGLAAMVVAYSIMGGFLFRAIEAPEELRDQQEQLTRLVESKARMIDDILAAVVDVCGPTEEATTATTRGMWRGLDDLAIQSLNGTLKKKFGDFQVEVKVAVKDNGWNGSDNEDEMTLQWSLAGAILYAVTVITTIGYGHIAPKTLIGRMLTIVYALIGIPLTFLYLSNIGNFLADCFRLFYKRICCDILCCQKCERKRKRDRLKLRRRRELAAQRNILLSMHSEMLSRLPPNDDIIDDDDDEDDDDGAFKSRGVTTTTATSATSAGRFPNENRSIAWNGGRPDALRSPASAAETFPLPPPSASFRSKNAEQEDDDDDDDDDDEDTGSESSVETVRETAIIDDDNNTTDDVIRESEIIDDGDFPSRRVLHPPPKTRVSRGATANGRPRTPSFHLNEFHQQLESAKETDILRDSSFEGEPRDFRLSRSKRRSQRYRSDPFLHASSSLLHDDQDPSRDTNRDPVSAGPGRTPVRSLTVKPRRYASKSRNPEFFRQGISVPTRSDSKRCSSAERWRNLRSRKGGPSESKTLPQASRESAAQERARANWKKLIEYTKQLAEKERVDHASGRRQESLKMKKKPEVKNEKPPEARRKVFSAIESAKSPPRKDFPDDRRWGQIEGHWSGGGHSGDTGFRSTTLPMTKAREPFHRSDDSFVTAASESGSSGGEAEEGQIQGDAHRVKQRSASLNSVAIDLSPSVDAAELPDFSEFIQEQPVSFLDDPFDYEEEEEQEGKVTVPISICLIIISGYLFAGSALFAVWENWDLVTGSYFCFVTLSTIGFGDIVPGTDMKEWESEAKLVLCALWLAFGLSLLAMCFNLMQEEVKDKCKWIGQKLGLLKDEGQN